MIGIIFSHLCVGVHCVCVQCTLCSVHCVCVCRCVRLDFQTFQVLTNSHSGCFIANPCVFVKALLLNLITPHCYPKYEKKIVGELDIFSPITHHSNTISIHENHQGQNQLESININQHQSEPIRIHQHQSSTIIGQHQSTSI